MPTPSFDSLSAFLAMGGHGFYVWFSVILAVIAVFGNVLALRFARRRFLEAAKARVARDSQPHTPAAEAAAASLLDSEVRA